MKNCWWILLLLLNSVQAWAQSDATESCSEADEQKIVHVLEAFPTPPFVALEKTGQTRFIMTSTLLSEVLGVSPHSFLINELDDLKFVPHSLSRSSMILVLREAKDWNDDKARKVSAIARLARLNLSLVWLQPTEAPASLVDLVHETGGRWWPQPELRKKIRQYVCSSQP